MISLINETLTNNDFDMLANWLKTYPRLTQSNLVNQFEVEFAKYIGRDYAVFVNSGSSANLIMAYAAKSLLGTEKKPIVVVPALAWATSLAPFVQLGYEVVFCDCDKGNLGIDIEQFQKLVKTYKPTVFLNVNVLGIPQNLQFIKEICDNNRIIFLEDACEALGSTSNGKNVGTFGEMATFSFYYGHHITTIEGGMIVTDDERLYYHLRMLRSHGWNKDLPQANQEALRFNYMATEFQDKFTFYVPGFNVRSTEINAFLGLRQLRKLNNVISKRHTNFTLYQKLINTDWKPVPFGDNNTVSNLGYPVITEKISKVVQALNKLNIECRPLIAGSLTEHPFVKHCIPRCRYHNIGPEDITFARYVHKYGMYIPNHSDLTMDDIQNITNNINGVMSE